jgi:hypothetical protein
VADTLTVADRFWSKVDLGGWLDCWPWKRAVGSHGYGALTVESKPWLAHRLAYTLLVGPIPKGLTIDHLCQNKVCVNPCHMEVVTRGENARRGEPNRQVRSGGGWMRQRDACANGHEYVPGSYRMWRGARVCKACANANRRRFRERTGR